MRSHSFWRSCHSVFDPRWAYAAAGSRGSRAWADEWLRRARRSEHRGGEGDDFFGAGLGARRPLRFLTWRLELTPEQTSSLARVLERLKLERAQAALDLRRAAAQLADAFEGEFGRVQAEAAAEQRATAARRAQDALAQALEALHALLDPEQRKRFADLIRTGAIRI
jgi:Spy/CpxP family protein refolding chaperone